MGLEIEEHRSRLINEQVFSDASLVIVMESGQKEALEVEYPQVLSRVHLLSELAGVSTFDVSDPAGEETEFYIQTGEELLALVNSAFDRILHMVQKI
jgi:protein-tyrosine-phosphatase